MKKVIIYLTNLTHVNNLGIAATESVPLNIGYLAAYLLKNLAKEIEIDLFNTHTELINAIDAKPPNIFAVSNYMWNSNISYYFASYIKQKLPNTITIMGGPKFPLGTTGRKEFLQNRQDIDFYIAGEGERAILDLVQICLSNELNIEKIKSEQRIQGCSYFANNTFVSNNFSERIVDLDSIPSPYLGGLLDKFLNNGFTPILQTNRGCPFACAYCCSSIDYYNKVHFFSIERVKDEIEYISQRVKSPSIHIHDDNFGMFSRDYDISCKFKEIIDKKKWPKFLSAATGKENKEKILRCVELLGSTILFSASFQSTNVDVLKNIDRKNLSLNELIEIEENLKVKGVESNSELIVPLPGETKRSHLDGIKKLMDVDVGAISPYTTMLLPSSPLYEDKKFDAFKMLMKYRVIPRDFGIYVGNNIFEVEKVCVETRDLSFAEYKFIRGFHFLIYCYYNKDTFIDLFKYIRALGCDSYNFCESLLINVESASTEIKRIFNEFVFETEKELWNSEKEIYDYYSKKENFSKLLNQEQGCNLIQKYNGIFFSRFEYFLKYAVEEVSLLLNKLQISYDEDELNSIYHYIKNTRVGILDVVDEIVIMEMPYDIYSWRKDGYICPLSNYKINVKLSFFQNDEQKEIIRNFLKIYGDSEDGKGKILTRINPKTLFRQVAVINEIK
jgi:radical SAM superfamily enzyme YgiQ (UPF0313 family)